MTTLARVGLRDCGHRWNLLDSSLSLCILAGFAGSRHTGQVPFPSGVLAFPCFPQFPQFHLMSSSRTNTI